jgi:hypothetical protein
MDSSRPTFKISEGSTSAGKRPEFLEGGAYPQGREKYFLVRMLSGPVLHRLSKQVKFAQHMLISGNEIASHISSQRVCLV